MTDLEQRQIRLDIRHLNEALTMIKNTKYGHTGWCKTARENLWEAIDELKEEIGDNCWKKKDD